MNASVSNALNAPALPSRTGSSADTCQPWKRLSGFILGHHGLACIDQAVVSGSSFVALIMIGRASDANQLGMYAIAMSILAVMLATQESLVTRPYAIQLHKPLGTPAEHAFSALVLSLLLSAAGSVLLSADTAGAKIRTFRGIGTGARAERLRNAAPRRAVRRDDGGAWSRAAHRAGPRARRSASRHRR